MGIYVFSRDVMLDILQRPGVDFGKEIIPGALGTLSVHTFLYRGYWADVGTIRAFYQANIQLTRQRRTVQLLSSALADLHASAIPAVDARERVPHRLVDRGRRAATCAACVVTDSVVGIRTRVSPGSNDLPDRCCSAPTSIRKRIRAATRSAWASGATS